VVVGSVLALLFVVMGVTASGLKWGSSGHEASRTASSSTTSRRAPLAGLLPTHSSTTVIVGATTLFVTTTVPLTTTTSTSTTTTTPKKSGLQVLGGPITLSSRSGAETLIVANTSKKAFTWDAESSLTGLALRPATGRLRSGGTQQVSVEVAGRLTPGAHGVIRFSSSAGDSQTVSVTVRRSSPPPSSSLSVSGAAVSPAQPDCTQSVQVAVQVGGGTAATVVLAVQNPSGVGQIAFSPVGGGRWVATIPALPAGGVFGSITARASDGRTAHGSVQYGVTHAGSC
jgi:hypothetical protein